MPELQVEVQLLPKPYPILYDTESKIENFMTDVAYQPYSLGGDYSGGG